MGGGAAGILDFLMASMMWLGKVVAVGIRRVILLLLLLILLLL